MEFTVGKESVKRPLVDGNSSGDEFESPNKMFKLTSSSVSSPSLSSRKFSCSHCNATFTRRPNLRVHMLKFHDIHLEHIKSQIECIYPGC